MLSTVKHRVITLLQLIVVMIYIIFEELIWEGIAKPVYTYVHSLKILQRIEVKVHSANPTLILFVFVMLLAVVEAFGVYAGVLFVSGQVVLGAALYIAKIPVAAFTFWLFRVTEDKLMQFGWFKWIYEKIMDGIAWLKSCEIYIRTMDRLKRVKTRVKEWFKTLKAKYFAKESPFITKIKQFYRVIKGRLRRSK
ncbi:hypothetical protein [Sulfurovum mangrovi]|uniref:hypothetical protein n=1 Tax=Sulfurovum mangrovi TaxID=2893889 RepID=UPI001E586FE0|nr:hypothetical protein [Sulfurovum mangrovi]UFH59573.1 hypothetical protein LN246_01680 [Sulfurovum mangrovi]UFH60713.1 hypothetical protein LN246_14225 [Sulfurovum mangrovi]